MKKVTLEDLKSGDLYDIDMRLSPLNMGYFNLIENNQQLFVHFKDVKWHMFIKKYKINSQLNMLKKQNNIHIKMLHGE